VGVKDWFGLVALSTGPFDDTTDLEGRSLDGAEEELAQDR
jgi:hypothetical protein